MKISSTFGSKELARFLLAFFVTVLCAVAIGEWYSRTFVVNWSAEARRAEEIYTSPVRNAVIGDSQMYYGFAAFSSIYQGAVQRPDFEMLALSGESALMMEVLAEEYFRFRKPLRVILPAGPQIFAQIRLDRRDARYGTYFKQNNRIQNAFGGFLYFFEPAISNFIWASAKDIVPRRLGQLFASAATAAEATAAGKCLEEPPNWTIYSQACREWLVRSRFRTQRPVDRFEEGMHF